MALQMRLIQTAFRAGGSLINAKVNVVAGLTDEQTFVPGDNLIGAPGPIVGAGLSRFDICEWWPSRVVAQETESLSRCRSLTKRQSGRAAT